MYHPHGLHLSKNQIANLARGRRVRLAHHQMSGPHKVFLRKDQLAKMSTRHSKGAGYVIQMDPDQLAYHAQTGGSIFDSLASWGRKFLSKAQHYLAPVANQLANSGLQFLEGEVVPRLQRKAVSMGDQLLSHGINYVDRGLSRLGAGVRKTARRRPVRSMQHGGNLWDDITGGIGSVFKTVAPIALPLAGQLIGKRLGLGLKRKRGGRGVLAPGQYARGITSPGY
jgi:hypothetical protein